MAETYEISVICRNCGHVPMSEKIEREPGPDPKRFQVPEGTEVKIFLRGITCDNCKCEGYMGLLNQPG